MTSSASHDRAVTTTVTVGSKDDCDELLDAAVAAALDGVGRLTFGRLAGRIGINDPSIVYSFPAKGDLVTEVVVALEGDSRCCSTRRSAPSLEPVDVVHLLAGADVARRRPGATASTSNWSDSRRYGRRRSTS